MNPCYGIIQKVHKDTYDISVTNQNGRGLITLNKVPLIESPSFSSVLEVGDKVFVSFNGGSLAGAIILGKTSISKRKESIPFNISKNVISTIKPCSSLIGSKYGTFEDIDIEKIKDDYINNIVTERSVCITHPKNSSSIHINDYGDIVIGSQKASITISKSGDIILSGDVKGL